MPQVAGERKRSHEDHARAQQQQAPQPQALPAVDQGGRRQDQAPTTT
jgi:hypothetical protein